MSTVIKKGQDGKLVQRLVSFDLADHLAEARSVVAAARREAGQIIEAAKRQGEHIRVEAREQGHREGYEEGHREGVTQGRQQALEVAGERFDRDHANLAASMTAVIESVEREKRDLLIEAGRDVLEFAVALAAKVTGCVAQANRQAAVANVERALRLVSGKTDVSIRVNPADAETLRTFAADRLAEIADRRHVRVIEDESITAGGAVVTSAGQEIDARIESQLAQITTLLLGQPSEMKERESG